MAPDDDMLAPSSDPDAHPDPETDPGVASEHTAVFRKPTGARSAHEAPAEEPEDEPPPSADATVIRMRPEPPASRSRRSSVVMRKPLMAKNRVTPWAPAWARAGGRPWPASPASRPNHSAATSRPGSANASRSAGCSQLTASARATYAPVIAAVLVPPSA